MVNEYFVYRHSSYSKWSLNDVVKYSERFDEKIWSARLSTGLFGNADCPSGNRGPRNANEILIGLGYEGLRKIIDLGFIPCPTCKPESYDRFWIQTHDIITRKYPIRSLDDFADKKILGFDARRLDWEEIFSKMNVMPSRIYLPEGLSDIELVDFQIRFRDIHEMLPDVGYYDANSAGRFTKYFRDITERIE